MAVPSSSQQSSPAGRERSVVREAFDPPRPQDRRIGRLVLHLALSACLIMTLLAVCLRLPHVDHATVALLLIAATVGLATVWGREEALIGAIIGGLGFDYFFLPPRGFGIEKPAHLVA